MDKFKMMPVEPTLAMCRAGLAERHDDLAKSIYAAMLAAAPVPAFDEAAERAAFDKWWFAKLMEHSQADEMDAAAYWTGAKAFMLVGYLACARLKAGQPS